ncbi:MAG: hypothetical protein ACUVX1_05325 [Chloroflexota bacterium]
MRTRGLVRSVLGPVVLLLLTVTCSSTPPQSIDMVSSPPAHSPADVSTPPKSAPDAHGNTLSSDTLGATAPDATGSTGTLTISNLRVDSSEVPLYDKFELTFDVENTVATNLQFPYDPAAPPGLPSRVGISVEGLFLPPGETDWRLALRQPGFLYQDYERRQIDSTEWLYPSGTPVWKVRFAPKQQGIWHYRLRVQDASICPEGVEPCPNWTETRAGSFTVGPPRPGNHGFIEVSKSDSRYFALSDGSPFFGLGFNAGFSNTSFTYDAEEQLARYAGYGIDFLRVWMSGSVIAGSSWSPWTWFEGPGYGGYMPDPGLWVAPSGFGHDFTLFLSQQANRLCLFNGFTQGHIAVKPSTTYRLAVTALARGISGPRNPSNPNYGFTVKVGGWPSSFPDGMSSFPSLIPHLHDSEWTTLEGTLTTSASQWFLDYLYLLLDNTSAGEVHISQVSLREVLPDGRLGPEILTKSRGDAHMDFDLLRSWDWDYVLDRAAERGVYLKLVILEKNDRVWNFINGDGTLTISGKNDNFYASPNTKVRRLHEYFWRYLAARWGYSTAVHSWELLNEGDPFNGHHYEQANSFAKYMHQVEPSRHLVTTSFWHSFPLAEFWGNAQYQDIDYADLHAYVSSGLGSYEWSAPKDTQLETDPAKTFQGSRGAIRVPAGVAGVSKDIWVRGRGDWRVSVMIRAEDIVGSCPYGAPSSLAGPQLLVHLEGMSDALVPHDPIRPDQYWICTSPAGTYDYKRVERTVSVPDDGWHRLHVEFRNGFATSGTAWFDNLQIQSPDGRLVRLYGDGTFDDRERMDYDTALFNEVYGQRYGAHSLSGPNKPVVRGETGIDRAINPQGELPELARDVKGVWLHNYLWGRLNPGGLYELYWWTRNIQRNDLYFQYKPLRDFLADVPLDNGHYRDAQARASDLGVGVVGQRDSVNGRAHLWIRNKNHTWWSVVNGTAWGRLSGTVAVPGFVPTKTYAIEWWEFDSPGNLTVHNSAATADAAGTLTLDLSTLSPLTTDVAIKVRASR